MTSLRLVGLSGGKDSTAMALRLKEAEPEHDYIFAITPTGRELPAMKEHWNRLEVLLEQPLLRVPAPSFHDLIVKFKMLPSWHSRWCTRLIKIEPFMAYAKSLVPVTTCIGIRADEPLREGTDWKGFEGVVQDFPLQRWSWELLDVLDYLKARGVIIPPRTDCDFCFFQRLIEWWELWKFYPALWLEGEAYEDLTGHTLRSDQRDSWPASMKELRARFEAGDIPLDTRKGKSPKAATCGWCSR